MNIVLFSSRDGDYVMSEKRTDYHATEHQEQCALFAWLDCLSAAHPELALAFAIPNGGKRHIATAIMLKAEGVKPGVPDIFIPVARNGYHGIFIELKAGHNRCTQEQLEWLRRLNQQGYLARWCWGWEAARDMICQYLGIENYNPPGVAVRVEETE